MNASQLYPNTTRFQYVEFPHASQDDGDTSAWRQSLDPCLLNQANADKSSPGPIDQACFPEACSMTPLALFQRETPDDPFVPGLVQASYRRTLADISLSSGAAPSRSVQNGPAAIYFKRNEFPIDTIRSSPLDVESGISYLTQATSTDEELMSSPGTLSPSPDTFSDSSYFPFPQHSPSQLLRVEPYCTLSEIQQFSDMESEILTKGLQETDFSLYEDDFKDHYAHHTTYLKDFTYFDDTIEDFSSHFGQGMKQSGGTSQSEDSHRANNIQPRKLKRSESCTGSATNQSSKRGNSETTKRTAIHPSTKKNANSRQELPNNAKSPTTKSTASPKTENRPFPCPLSPYGCEKTFTSKNEWKRHIVFRHLYLGSYRCDLCKDCDTRPNVFNRKDLFTQHLRRMHHPLKDEIDNGIPSAQANGTKGVNSKGSQDLFEEAIPVITERCWIRIRDAPSKISCAFCTVCFKGEDGFWDWIEHVGKHLSEIAKQRRNNNGGGRGTRFMADKWINDTFFRSWLLEMGFLKPGDKPETWILVSDATIRDINMYEMRKKGIHGTAMEVDG